MALFQSGMSALQRQLQQTNDERGMENDELYNMNFEAILNPNGPPDDSRHFISGAEFQKLQANATLLLQQFQEAYRGQARALAELNGEHSLDSEKVQELSTRNRQLEVELENTRRKAREHEESIVAILEELTSEKKARVRIEQAAKEKGIILIPAAEVGSVATEDLGVESDQRRRKWMQTISTPEEEDTDEESFDGSVFSRSRSPTIAPSVFEGGIESHSPTPTPSSAPHYLLPNQQKVVNLTPPPNPKSKPRSTQQQQQQQQQQQHQQQQQGTWTFQTIIRGISGDTKEGAQIQPEGCSNCRGQKASAAWDTVSLLRDENRELKSHRAEMEVGIDEALEILSGREWKYLKK
jgi:hypothetical protein